MQILHNWQIAFKRVYKGKKYWLFFTLFVVIYLFLTITIKQLSFIIDIIQSNLFSFYIKTKLIALVYLNTDNWFISFSDLFLNLLISILVALNLTVLIYYWSNQYQAGKAGSKSGFSLIFSLLGVGCSTCGSVVLSSFISIGLSTSILGFFPLQGVEFSLLAVILLLWSSNYIIKRLIHPPHCVLKKKNSL